MSSIRLAWFLTTALSGLGLAEDIRAQVVFNRDIRPILADACFHCHGPDPGSRKAGLRLDTREGLFGGRDGTVPVVPGKPQVGSLLLRIRSTDPDEVMPPPEAHRQLKPAEVERIERWIAQGALWQPHWSLVAAQRPVPPLVRRGDWPRNPLDRFVLAKLEAAGLEPAPEADALTLLRRLSLDLTGLAPPVSLVQRFEGKATLSDDEVGRLVDDFLKLPAYGEHRARYWLDAARYGDTHGLHFDNYREMWPYRDWVVRAFNRNQPYDQFSIEQIAGDLLPNRSDEQLIATGFQRCNITTNEGGTIDEENLANYAVDRVQTLGWVYLGLTTNCAQCHDHKFDPITARDFYSLAAFFRNTTQQAKDGNVKDGRGPVLVIPSEADRGRWQEIPAAIEMARKAREDRRRDGSSEFAAWLSGLQGPSLRAGFESWGQLFWAPLDDGAGHLPRALVPSGGQLLGSAVGQWLPKAVFGPAPQLGSGRGIAFERGGELQLGKPFSIAAWIKAGRADVSGAVVSRMDEKQGFRGWDVWQEKRSLGVHLIDQWPQRALKVVTRDPVLKPGQWQHVTVTCDGSGRAEGISLYVDGKLQRRALVLNNSLPSGADILAKTALRVGQRSQGSPFVDGSVQDLRLFDRSLTESEALRLQVVPKVQAALSRLRKAPKAADRDQLLDHYLATRDALWQRHDRQVALLEQERAEIQGRSAVTHIQQERPGSEPKANILMRGQYDQVGEEVRAEVPAALGRLPNDAPRNRLGLARWLVSAENPLTARVAVNRFWQEVFGQGLVRTPEDFGIMGAAPTHPELLDWLAVEFRESGWDVKRFFRLLVSSATYRQSAAVTPLKLERDRDNGLLSRGPRFRMDAEVLRDYALMVSGLLSQRMGGPSVKPYQPEGIWDVVGLPGGDTREFVQDKGENVHRRSLYTFWKRMAPPPNMEIFNAPSREVCSVRRERTNTPLQALVTLNDPQFVEAARVLAQRAMRAVPNDDAACLQWMARRVLCRPLDAVELPLAVQSLREMRALYEDDLNAASSLLGVGITAWDADLSKAGCAALTMVANQWLNLDEVLTK